LAVPCLRAGRDRSERGTADPTLAEPSPEERRYGIDDTTRNVLSTFPFAISSKAANQIKYDEAAEDFKRHYRTTKTRDLEEAGYRFQNLDTFFEDRSIDRIGPAQVTAYVEKR
jgi:hypothetical protein